MGAWHQDGLADWLSIVMLMFPKCFLFSFWYVTGRNIHLRRTAPWVSWGTTLEIICITPFVDRMCKLLDLFLSHKFPLSEDSFNWERNIFMSRTVFKIFIFEGCILLRLSLLTFYGSVNRNWYFLNVLYFITYPLHVSTPMGHLHVD
jgi:hypothetical protein